MSSKNVNPIDVYFSKGNVNALYETVQSYFRDKHNKEIGREYLSEILEIMKMVVKPLPKKIEKNKINVKKFVTTLNQQTLREAIPLFENSISPTPQLQTNSQGTNSQGTNSQGTNSQGINPQLGIQTNDVYLRNPANSSQYTQQMQQMQQMQNRQPNMQGMSLPGGIPQPSYGGSMDDGMRQTQELDTLLAQMSQDRGIGNGFGQKPPEIDFTKIGNSPASNDPKFNAPVSDLFQQQQNYRQNGNDVAIPPPSLNQLNQLQQLQQGPFQITENFQVSNPPIYQPNNTNELQNIPGIPNVSTQFQSPQNNFVEQGMVPINTPDGAMSTSILDIRNREIGNQSASQKITVDSIYNNEVSSIQSRNQSQNQSQNQMFENTEQAFEQAFAPQQYQQMTPRINRQVNQNIQAHDFAQVANSMNEYNPIAPQPGQMRVLIPKTSRNTTAGLRSNTIPVNLSVDSRNKDPTQSHSSYRIDIDEIKDVLSIELTDAQIPISEYSINESNNVIYFEETDGTVLTAEIIPGNYTPTGLATEIETQMTNAGSSNYTVAVDTLQNRFIFSSDGAGGSGIFNLLFFGGTEPIGFERERTVYIERSIGPVIGFSPEDQTSALMYTGQFTYNLKGESYILLYVKEAELIKTRDSNVKNAFAKIVLDQPLGNIKYYNRNIDNKFIRHFSPAVGRLGHLTIEFRKQNGDLYDFNGQSNSLSFEVITKDLTTPIYQDGISVTNV